jgi:hypothetical protein
MRGAVELKLLVGPVPVPAPRALMEAFVSAKVDMGAGSTPSGFELHFEFSLHSKLRSLFLATSGAGASIAPFVRVVMLVVMDGRSEQLMCGVITHIDAQPTESGNSRVTIFGKDLSAFMDRDERPGTAFAGLTPSNRVRKILLKYVPFGVLPQVIPSLSETPPLPMHRAPQQRGTDYAYICKLAKEAGYVFYLEAGAVAGTASAYWGPEVRVGRPQPALTTGMDGMNTVDQLSFSFDREKAELPVVHVQAPFVKRTIPVPVPLASPLNPPLGLVPPLPPKIVHLNRTGHLSFGEAFLRGIAHVAAQGDALTGRGQLDVARYGHVLKSRRLVGVRGAGTPYDGLYYVTQVTHQIARGSYTQSFELARNGLVSTVPTVPV